VVAPPESWQPSSESPLLDPFHGKRPPPPPKPPLSPAAFASALLALLPVGCIAAIPVGILEQVVLPTWVTLIASGARDELVRSYRRYTNIGLAGAAAAGLFITANDTQILSLLFGPDYIAARWPLRWAVWSTIFGAVTGPNEGMLRAFGASRAILGARLIAAVAGTGVAALLIPGYGLPAAVAAFVVTAVVLKVGYAVTLYRTERLLPFSRSHTVTTLLTLAGILTATVGADLYPSLGRATATALAIVVIVATPDLRSELRRLAS